MSRYIRLKHLAFLIAIALALPLFSADKYWTGAANANASNKSNWCDDAELQTVSTAAPANGDDIHLLSGSAAMTWDLNIYVNSWEQDGYTGTVTFKTGNKHGTSQTLYGYTEDSKMYILKVTGNIVLNTGKWTGATQPSLTSTYTAWINGQGIFRILVEAGGDVTIGSAATITTKAQGFAAYQGPGGSGASNKSCAAHGGVGAICAFVAGATNCYGVVRDPITIGSSSNYKGGGAVRIVCGGAMTLNGTIDVSGEDGKTVHRGAGGSISIIAGSISGAGTLNANGGYASNNSHDNGGAGGRISVVLTDANADFSGFTGVMKAKCPYKTGSSYEDGSGGTIYKETAADGVGGGILIIDNIGSAYNSNSHPSYRTYTRLTSSIYNVNPKKIVLMKGAKCSFEVPGQSTLPPMEIEADATVGSDGYFRIGGTANVILTSSPAATRLWLEGATISAGAQGDGTYTVESGKPLYLSGAATIAGSLEVLYGGSVTHFKGVSPAMNAHVTGDLVVNSGGSISANSMGDSSYGSFSKKGGSHGGRARDAAPRCYGSVRRPATYGTAGDGGGSGGGLVRMTVDGDMTVNGTVRANGGNGTNYGGSGGSVWLTGRSLSGSGHISANGGGQTGTTQNSPGGGGRVAVYLTGAGEDFSGFAGKITAYGGTSASKNMVGKVDAGAGTVYLKKGDELDNEGTLVIANSNTTAYVTDIMTGGIGQNANVTALDVGEVVIDGGKLFVSNATMTVTRGWETKANGALECSDNGVLNVVGAADAHFLGLNPFWAFFCEVPGKALYFGTGAGDCLSIADGGKFVVAGEEGNPVELRPETAGETWSINVPVSQLLQFSVENALVERSVANASTEEKVVALNSTDSPHGSCTNWRFVSAAAEGETITWTGESDSGWNSSDNWDLGRTPSANDMVVIPVTVNDPSLPSEMIIADLEIAQGARLLLAGNNLSVTGRLVVNGQIAYSGSEAVEASATNIVLASGSVVPAQGTFLISGDANQTASVNASFWNLAVRKSGGTLSWSGSTEIARTLSFATDAAYAVAFASGSSLTADVFHAAGTVDSQPALTLSGSWSLDVAKLAKANGVQIGGCDASGGSKLYARDSSVDLGSNVNCYFGEGLFVWTGAANSSFDNTGNWLDGVVPGENDIAEISSAASITVTRALSLGGLFLGGEGNAVTFTARGALDVAGDVYVGRGATLVLDATATVGGYFLVEGGTVTHTAGGTAETYKINLAVGGDMLVDETGMVHANGKGYSGAGPGKGPSGGVLGAGASHGGMGSWYSDVSKRKPCYGSFVSPDTYGSGGYLGGDGGGAVKIVVSGDLYVFGTISANATTYDWYTAAGGSVWIKCRDLLGYGVISATGGNGTSTGYDYLLGGGGRISIEKTGTGDFSSFAGVVKAYGGYHTDTELYGQPPAGSCGSIAWIRPGERPLVVIDNKSSNKKNCDGVELPVTSQGDLARTIRNLDFLVRNSGKLYLTDDVTIWDLSLATANATLYLNGHTLTIRSRVHKDRAGWSGTVNTGTGGKIVWVPDGLRLTVR